MYIRQSKTSKVGQEVAFWLKSLIYVGLAYLFLAAMTRLALPLLLAISA